MKRTWIALFCCASMIALSGCSTLNHRVGSGAPDDAPTVASKRQWYALFGLIPINKVDGGQMAKEKGLTNNYTIKSQASLIDQIFNCFTGILTISGQSVKVKGVASPAPAAATLSAVPAAGGDPFVAANKAMGSRDYQGAIALYQAAIAANPNHAGAYQGLGTAHYYLGQKAEALTAFKKSLELNPNNPQLANTIKTMQ